MPSSAEPLGDDFPVSAIELYTIGGAQSWAIEAWTRLPRTDKTSAHPL